YEEAQGNNAWFAANGYGTTHYVDLLNMTDYIDYMLMNIYVGNDDWPNHNFYAAINTVDPTGFEFFSWDAEQTMGLVNPAEGSQWDSTLSYNATGYNPSTGVWGY